MESNHLDRKVSSTIHVQIIETINQGTYGLVFSGRDVTKVYGVIKVAKSMANEAGNVLAEWKGFILETILKSTA
uniref:Uncharacterized protein n=1 Tax=Wuchereria bancrofti TaxID=6293 RepID=A0AAF5PKM2_WUCBA